MLDWRALIVALLLIASAVAGFVVLERRTRALNESRSLSAAPHPTTPTAQPQTRSLHVEGCDEDFIVKVGELVEPRVVSGASVERFRSVYGQETKRDKSGIATWKSNPFTLTEGDSGGGKGGFVHLAVDPGHVVETLDGVDLGIDSFATLLHKMRDRKVEVGEQVTGGDGKWTLTMTVSSGCGRRYLSEYSRTLEASPEINPLIAGQIGPDGKPGPLRSDVFLNKVIYDYTLKSGAGAKR